jgi:hypothetical protein
MSRLTALLVCGAACALVAVPAAAQTVEVFGAPVTVRTGIAATESHGANLNCSVLSVADLVPVEHDDYIHMAAPGYIKAASESSFVHTSVHLEVGVLIDRLCARVYDTDNTHQLVVLMGAFEAAEGAAPPVAVPLVAMGTGVAETPGYALLCADINPPIQVRTRGDLNNDGIESTLQYWAGAIIPGCEVMAGPIIVSWNRPVSPAPAVARFPDAPTTHRYFQWIEALAASGVTSGCGGGLFCPEDHITRGEVAVWMAAALSLNWPN